MIQNEEYSASSLISSPDPLFDFFSCYLFGDGSIKTNQLDIFTVYSRHNQYFDWSIGFVESDLSTFELNLNYYITGIDGSELNTTTYSLTKIPARECDVANME